MSAQRCLNATSVASEREFSELCVHDSIFPWKVYLSSPMALSDSSCHIQFRLCRGRLQGRHHHFELRAPRSDAGAAQDVYLHWCGPHKHTHTRRQKPLTQWKQRRKMCTSSSVMCGWKNLVPSEFILDYCEYHCIFKCLKSV